MNEEKTLETVNLIQGYYNYMYLATFLEETIKRNDLSKYAKDINIKTGQTTEFTINGEKIKTLLKNIHNNNNKKNIYGYFTQIVIFEQIIGIIRELIDNSKQFKQFCKKILGNQYFSFEQIIRFSRNCLSHATSVGVELKLEDFEKQKYFLITNSKSLIHLKFIYKEKLGNNWKGSDNYGVNIRINFKNITEGIKFFDIIPLHSMFLLIELSYNLGELYKNIYNKDKSK